MPPLHHRQAVDDALVVYLEWREHSAVVWDAYGRWANAPREDKESAYVAYQATLDREEAAANAYATLVTRAGEPRDQTARTAHRS